MLIKRQSFNGVLENYPSEQQRFRLVKESNKTDGGAAKREHDAASLSGLEPGSCLVFAMSLRRFWTCSHLVGSKDPL